MNFKQSAIRVWKKTGIPYFLAIGSFVIIYNIVILLRSPDTGFADFYVYREVQEEINKGILLMVLVKMLGG